MTHFLHFNGQNKSHSQALFQQTKSHSHALLQQAKDIKAFHREGNHRKKQKYFVYINIITILLYTTSYLLSWIIPIKNLDNNREHS